MNKTRIGLNSVFFLKKKQNFHDLNIQVQTGHQDNRRRYGYQIWSTPKCLVAMNESSTYLAFGGGANDGIF